MNHEIIIVQPLTFNMVENISKDGNKYRFSVEQSFPENLLSVYKF